MRHASLQPTGACDRPHRTIGTGSLGPRDVRAPATGHPRQGDSTDLFFASQLAQRAALVLQPDHEAADRNGADLVAAGFWSGSRYFEQPSDQELNPATVEVPSIGSQGVVYVRWLVRGRGPFTVTVDSVKGGMASGVSQ